LSGAAQRAAAFPPGPAGGSARTAWRDLLELFTRHRQLTLEMARRELHDRYLGQVFGVLWALLHPVVLMAVYVLVFGYIFKVRLGGTTDLPLNYTVYLLSGLIPWLTFQESLAKSSTVIPNNANLVKQVIFPVEVLPVKGVLASLVTQAVFVALLCSYVLAAYGFLPATYGLLPVLMAMQGLFMIGIAYLVSAVSVYFRDVKDLVQVFAVTGVYLVPAFYLPESVPGAFRVVLYLNPVSYLIWCFQDVLFFGRIEHWWAWAVLAPLSVASFYAGYRAFSVLRTMFGNVL
jgi:lipopolysaccharide transport system permease protein